ncbi:MAG: thioesterase family protein [Bacteroidia bacterium]|nr:thioesterase family protein [Bacteroidia bacterium]NND26727.1 acyl-CoA thioesterase [Flavobacteriaceae bacterium]MBT8278131.1 thioesterase family protein [Bacteroidia bacterium]NNK61347.1 acyl-CoA thioesterase [Flavobacteriaceae bacterium]NNL31803.1 acyl-CoA thioesterase [Flavobacteriaceae bacterium]
MEFFETTLTVENKDLDELNHVNNVQYVHWINEIAKQHWLHKATEKLLNSHFWVVVKHTINYKKPAFLNDELKLKTFVKHSEGVLSTRVVEIYNNESNDLLVRAETEYCLIDAQSQRPARIPTEIINLFN